MALVSINWNPADKQLRSFGAISVVVFGAVAAYAGLRHHLLGVSLTAQVAQTVSVVLGALAVLCALFAVFAPRMLRPLFLCLSVVTSPIGFVVSHLLLAVVFFFVFTPIGFCMRLVGFDPLERKIEKQRTSYWQKRTIVTDVGRYFRQY